MSMFPQAGKSRYMQGRFIQNCSTQLATNDAVFANRLDAEESALRKRLPSKVVALTNAPVATDTRSGLLDDLLLDLDLMAETFTSAELACLGLAEECGSQLAEFEELEREIASTEADIQMIQTTLDQERRRAERCREYDALAEQIRKQASREETQARHRDVEHQVKALEARQAARNAAFVAHRASLAEAYRSLRELAARARREVSRQRTLDPPAGAAPIKQTPAAAPAGSSISPQPLLPPAPAPLAVTTSTKPAPRLPPQHHHTPFSGGSGGGGGGGGGGGPKGSGPFGGHPHGGRGPFGGGRPQYAPSMGGMPHGGPSASGGAGGRGESRYSSGPMERGSRFGQ